MNKIKVFIIFTLLYTVVHDIMEYVYKDYEKS